MGTSDIFDHEILQSLLETLGKDALSGLITGFLETSDHIVEQLKSMGAGQTMFEKAHEMKGMAANYGFAELSAIARDIEDSSQAQDIDAAKTHIEKLSDANQRAKLAINEWLETAG